MLFWWSELLKCGEVILVIHQFKCILYMEGVEEPYTATTASVAPVAPDVAAVAADLNHVLKNPLKSSLNLDGVICQGKHFSNFTFLSRSDL